MFVITECSLTTEFVITEFHCTFKLRVKSTYDFNGSYNLHEINIYVSRSSLKPFRIAALCDLPNVETITIV
jgi:hypothetical protein